MVEHRVCGKNKKRIQVCVPKETALLIQELAKKMGISRGELIDKAVRAYMDMLKRMALVALNNTEEEVEVKEGEGGV